MISTVKKAKKAVIKGMGSYNKTIINKMPMEVPREGEYDPQFVPKGIRRFKDRFKKDV